VIRKRYQHCSWLVRRWRDRWLLLVPYWAFRTWLRGEDLPHWSVARGWCDYRRDYVYTYAEIKERHGWD
jgi:hypothetical protein